VALGLAVLGAAAVGTFCGAGVARRPFAPAPLAESALARSLAERDPEPARRALDVLRERLRSTPLDSATRTITASLLAETATIPADKDTAARQAQDAVRLTPSDDGVARGAAGVLARCGRTDVALRDISAMFAFDPGAAAAALADIEPFVAAERLEEGLPASAAAWLAWYERLRASGRTEAAAARLAALLQRWPSDLPAIAAAASVAAGRGRVDEVARLVPPSMELPATAAAAPLHAYRAQTKAAAGDAAGARADARRAIALSNDDPSVLMLAGDALLATEAALARDFWNRALHILLAKPATRDRAVWVRYRLARLDDREGRAGDALRAWRSILAERPNDGEATRRIAELTGEVHR